MSAGAPTEKCSFPAKEKTKIEKRSLMTQLLCFGESGPLGIANQTQSQR